MNQYTYCLINDFGELVGKIETSKRLDTGNVEYGVRRRDGTMDVRGIVELRAKSRTKYTDEDLDFAPNYDELCCRIRE